jgi:hypothetical protein
MLVSEAAHIEETATQLAARQKLNFQETDHAGLLAIAHD